MQAVVCRKPGELALEERPEPRRGEAKCCRSPPHRNLRHGLSHLSRAAIRFWNIRASWAMNCPARCWRRRGQPVEAGQTVVVNPYLSCGTCIACRNGKPNCCVRIAVLGVHRDGGMCERISVPEGNLYPAGKLTLDQAASVEFLAIGAHAVARSVSARRPHARDRRRSDRARAALSPAWPAAKSRSWTATPSGLPSRWRRHRGTVDRGGGSRAELVRRPQTARASTSCSTPRAAAPRWRTPSAMSPMAGPGAGQRGDRDISFSDPEFHKREMTVLGSRNALSADFENVMAAIETAACRWDACLPTARASPASSRICRAGRPRSRGW